MRVLLLTQLFHPEPNLLKGLEFAKALQEAGCEVEVLTGFPNYPEGKVYPGYKITTRQRETISGIPVTRVPYLIDHGRSALKRALSYSSAAASLSSLGLASMRKPDVVHVYQGPATLCMPAMALKALRGVPWVLDLQDLWPESVTESGMARVPGLEGALHVWCNATYRSADKIVVLGQGYKRVLIERGVPESKIEVVYNWCDRRQELSFKQPPAFIPDTHGLEGRFNVVYAGNIGSLQKLDVAVHAAQLIKKRDPRVQIVFVGAGTELEGLKKLATELGTTNVRFIARVPVEQLQSILARADCQLIHLRESSLARVGIPSKTQASLLAGRPIIIGVNGEAGELVERAQAGIKIPPDDPSALASAILKLASMPPDQLQQLGVNGRKFYEAELSLDRGVQQMLKVFNEVASSGRK